MIDITPELIEVITELHDTTAKLTEITQTLLHELYLMRNNITYCNEEKQDIK